MVSNNNNRIISETKFELQKKVGFWSAVALLAGSIIGTGIFVSPGGVLSGMHGSVGLSLVMWVACGILSALASLCYAELGSCIVESGAEFAYNNAAIGAPAAFVYAWTKVLMIKACSFATLSMVSSTYLLKLAYPDCTLPQLTVKLMAICVLAAVTFVNSRSVKVVAKGEIVLTITKLAVLTVIIVAGLVELIRGNLTGIHNYMEAFNEDNVSQVSAGDVCQSLFQAIYAYNGFANINLIVEEVKDVKKHLPRIILTALSLVTAYYLLVNIAYFSVLSPAEMLHSEAVALSFAQRCLGNAYWVVSLGVVISAFGAINGALLVTSRIPFAASRRGIFPQIFSMINVTTYTPTAALYLVSTAGLIMIFPTDIKKLVNAFGFSAWLFYGLTSLNLLILRRTRPDIERPFKVPIIIPVIVIMTSIFLVIVPLVFIHSVTYIYASLFMSSGFVVYYIFVYRKITLIGTHVLTNYLQKLLFIAPTDWEEIKF